ncbi:hypothetical protein G7K_6273-t1 [Saitoella complicata NRRL Y-17804]|uniref:Uncharacterized protein n=1 Tax=Saitoella complicata (strain BCRC 22490 / CBS 7301 / JCM 7358 / NBRC 10748 / NRRL Y-17804) TaxID=698492 RepID=A0A0E9NRX9_SAICN|nr:hypothetical protein G7K_6273-t1 [Saitoella complicata NRRL Y-17804]
MDGGEGTRLRLRKEDIYHHQRSFVIPTSYWPPTFFQRPLRPSPSLNLFSYAGPLLMSTSNITLKTYDRTHRCLQIYVPRVIFKTRGYQRAQVEGDCKSASVGVGKLSKPKRSTRQGWNGRQ